MTKVSAGGSHSIALSGGNVLCSSNDNLLKCNDLSSWNNLADINVGTYHALGLRSDRTVLCAGDNSYGQCDVSGW